MPTNNVKNTPIPSELIDAYRQTCFRVSFPDGDSFDVYIGKTHPDLDAKLHRYYIKDWTFQQIQHCTDWAIVTAYNPGSKSTTTKAEDKSAHDKLVTELKANDRVRFFEANGIGSDGHSEKSVLVQGLDLQTAFELGKRYGQNAIVHGELGNVARLVGCVDRSPRDLDEMAFQKHMEIIHELHRNRVQHIANDEFAKSKNDITSTDTSSKELIYGTIDDWRCLVFIPKWNALACAHFWDAINAAETWRELKEMLSTSAYKWVLAYEGKPKALDDNFRAAFRDNADFPYFPPQRMKDWMPPDIFKRHAELEDSFLDGPLAEISPEATSAIVSALEVEGYTCVRDDKLIQAASGFTG